jgi:hypothetical protein
MWHLLVTCTPVSCALKTAALKDVLVTSNTQS